MGVVYLLLYVPVGVGIIIGIILLVLTLVLKKKSASLAKIPSYLGLLISAIVFIISFSVRGFEGAAYGFTGFTVLVFTVLTFYIAKNTPKAKSL